MNTEKYIVRLTDAERRELEIIVKKLKGTSQKVKRAIVLLKADADGPDWTNEKIHELTGVSIQTIVNIRKQLVTEGFEVTLNRKKRRLPPVPKKTRRVAGSPNNRDTMRFAAGGFWAMVASVACQPNGCCGKPHRVAWKSPIRSVMKRFGKR